MKRIADEERIIQQIDRESREQRERMRALIAESGNSVALSLYNIDMREIDLGLKSARSCWASISPAQARALAIAGTGAVLWRKQAYPLQYTTFNGPLGVVLRVCSLATARALCAHELLAPDGGAFDPESKFVITERGSFVLHHGHHLGSWY